MTDPCTTGLSVEEFTRRIQHMRSMFASIAEINDSFAKASAALNQLSEVTEKMELVKLKQEKRVLEERLRDVIQTELSKFSEEHGLHPANIGVDITRVYRAASRDPDYILGDVTVEFGL